jgi:hypothetical protein
MKATFLDFDGVIIDSIKECFIVSKEQYFEIDNKLVSNAHKSLFFKWRGITGPAWQFLVLHRAIAAFLVDNKQDIRSLFHHMCENIDAAERRKIEQHFFSIRKKYQADLEKWFLLNPLTEYGLFLQEHTLDNYHIVTTKNREAVEMLLDHYQIKIRSIFDVEDYHKWQTKGRVIFSVMEKSGAQEGIFVDDSVVHLDTIDDSRITCYFAPWGYGENTFYPNFEKRFW